MVKIRAFLDALFRRSVSEILKMALAQTSELTI